MIPKGNFKFKHRSAGDTYMAIFNPFLDTYSIAGTGELVPVDLMESLIKDKVIQVIKA